MRLLLLLKMASPPCPTATATVIRRLRREDCRRTKHDSAFSNWKVRIFLRRPFSPLFPFISLSLLE